MRRLGQIADELPERRGLPRIQLEIKLREDELVRFDEFVMNLNFLFELLKNAEDFFSFIVE